MSKPERDDYFYKIHIEQMDEDYWYVGIYGLHDDDEVLWAMVNSKREALNKAINTLKKELEVK